MWNRSAKIGESVKLFDTICSISLDNLLQCTFGFKSNCQNEKNPESLHKSLQRTYYAVYRQKLKPLRIDMLYWLTSHGRKTNKVVHDHAEKVMAQRRAAILASQRGDSSVGNDLEPHKQVHRQFDFLDILLMARDEEGSDLEIRN